MAVSAIRYPLRGESASKTLLVGAFSWHSTGWSSRRSSGWATSSGCSGGPHAARRPRPGGRTGGGSASKAFAVLLAYVLLTAGIALQVLGPDASVELLATLFGSPLLLVVGLLTGALEPNAPELTSLVVLYVLSQYVTPAALANHAEHGTLRAGFAFRTLRPVLGSWTYVRGWVAFQAVSLLGLGIAFVLMIALGPLLGGLVAAFTSFYLWVVGFSIIGRTWGRIRAEENSASAADGPPA
jgi:hypothetical protein